MSSACGQASVGSTIAGSPLGDTSLASTGRKTLLGQ